MSLLTWKSVRKRNYLYWKSVFYLLFMLKHNLVSLHPHKLKNAVFLTFKESFICGTNFKSVILISAGLVSVQ